MAYPCFFRSGQLSRLAGPAVAKPECDRGRTYCAHSFPIGWESLGPRGNLVSLLHLQAAISCRIACLARAVDDKRLAPPSSHGLELSGHNAPSDSDQRMARAPLDAQLLECPACLPPVHLRSLFARCLVHSYLGTAAGRLSSSVGLRAVLEMPP